MDNIERSKQFRKLLVAHATKAENRFRKLLKSLDIKFIFQKEWIQDGGFYISDFYFSDKKATIELDGEYHNEPDQKERDKKKAKWLKSIGILTYRLTNEKVAWMSDKDLKTFLRSKKLL